MKESKEKIKGELKENLKLINVPLMSILPGQIAFFVVLSIIPLASILVMIISKLSLNFDIVTNFISHYIPSSIANIIISIFEQQKVGAIDIFFIVMAFYLASKATHSIIVASTEIYNGKQRDFIRTRVKAVIILITLVSLVISVVGIITIGSKFVAYLCEISGDGHSYIRFVYDLLKWPFVFFMVFFTIKIVYTVAPNVNIPSKSVNKGALFTTIVWVISTYAFSFYVTNIANYTKFYGNLSSLIILMIWIYWLCYMFVYGMTINEYKLNNENVEYVIEKK